MVSASCRSPECLGQRTLLVQNAYHGPAVLRAALWEVLLLVDWRGKPGLALQVTLCWWRQLREAGEEGGSRRGSVGPWAPIYAVTSGGTGAALQNLGIPHTDLSFSLFCVPRTSTVVWHSINKYLLSEQMNLEHCCDPPRRWYVVMERVWAVESYPLTVCCFGIFI